MENYIQSEEEEEKVDMAERCCGEKLQGELEQFGGIRRGLEKLWLG